MRSRGPVSTLADEWATVEGVVAKGFTSKSGNTLLNIGAAYPNQTFTDWLSRFGPVAPHFGQTLWNLFLPVDRIFPRPLGRMGHWRERVSLLPTPLPNAVFRAKGDCRMNQSRS